MNFQEWWQQKSRRAKAVTVLSTLLVLQIGLCFGTPVAGSHLSRDPFAALGYMAIEAILALVVFLALVGVLIFYRSTAATSKPPGTASSDVQGHSESDEGDRSDQ